MATTNSGVSAYSAPQSRTGGLWADKARLRKFLMFSGVGAFFAIAAVFYLMGGR